MKKLFRQTGFIYCQITGFLLISLFALAFHPFYLSVTELNYDKAQQQLQISCKIFTDDFEKTLRAQHKSAIDLTHPGNKVLTEKYISDYIQSHIKININKRNIAFKFIGYEIEEEAVWCYFESDKIELPSKIEITNSILYELLPDQINIVHANVNNVRKSAKIGFPDKLILFQFD